MKKLTEILQEIRVLKVRRPKKIYRAVYVSDLYNEGEEIGDRFHEMFFSSTEDESTVSREHLKKEIEQNYWDDEEDKEVLKEVLRDMENNKIDIIMVDND